MDTNKEAYEKALDLEVVRECHWRKTPQGAFESAMLSVEGLTDSFDDPTKIAAFSDGGAGVQAIIDYMDGVGTAAYIRKCLDRARKLIERNNPKLLRTFRLILKNGSNRKASICEIAKDMVNSHTKYTTLQVCDTPEN